MDRRDLGFLLMAALTTVLVVAIRWIVHRYDISRIRSLLQRDGRQLLTYRKMFFGPNWLTVWLSGCREFEIQYKDSQFQIYESTVLTSIVFGTQFFNEQIVDKNIAAKQNDAALQNLIDRHKSK